MEPTVIQLDMRGQVCPSTLLVALREINRNASALREKRVILSFLTDNRDATGTIPDAADNMGFTSEVREQDGYYDIRIS
jgi:TusA-related sulfurtransferase